MIEALWAWFYEVFIERLDFWMFWGLVAQSMFMMRFLVQWLASERVGKSIVPIAFWFFSMGGGLLLFTYGIARKDAVIILGQGLGLVIYFRNLRLIYKERRKDPSF